MFTIAVYEERPAVCKLIDQLLSQYAFQTSLIYKTLWMKCLPTDGHRAELFPSVRLALLSMDLPDAGRAAEELYRYNPACRIIFYSNVERNVVPLLRVRPIGFCLCSEEAEGPLEELLPAVFSDIQANAETFSFENRDGLYLFDAADILYFQSELKTVSIHCAKASPMLVIRKLSEIMQSLTDQKLHGAFIRIHQSYIVNRKHIQCLDKRSHMVVLSSGETIPISDSWYDSVKKRLSLKNDT